ncbi:MAG: hypothetical protein QM526_02395 [Alphaproteobacteria bacterium]|nr:hypothetical protein [Alphaproteobacteria bacterium]
MEDVLISFEKASPGGIEQIFSYAQFFNAELSILVIFIGIAVLISYFNKLLGVSLFIAQILSALLLPVFPYKILNGVLNFSSFINKGIVYVVLLTVLTLIVYGIITQYKEHERSTYIEALLVALLNVSVWYTTLILFLDATTVFNFSSTTLALFSHAEYTFAYFMVPIILFFIVFNTL